MPTRMVQSITSERASSPLDHLIEKLLLQMLPTLLTEVCLQSWRSHDTWLAKTFLYNILDSKKRAEYCFERAVSEERTH